MSAVLKLVCDNPATHKACGKCSAVKQLDEFHKCSRSSDGLKADCKTCRNATYHKRGYSSRRDPVLVDGGRICNVCKVEKPWDQFAREKIGINQKTSACIPCRRSKFRAAYRANPAVRRANVLARPHTLMRKYGITISDVVRTYDAQHGKCANHACSRDITLETAIKNRVMKNKAMIDHNHATGKFRALLCMQCNLTLGYLEKQENIILGLQDYLTKHNQ